ncbi:hypothetical protein BTJ40_06850 [Microbulbifer sp. A4B17]|nr:hypothetical protein BTJ40_06850 [Microbulbifer sp. A4B17]
MLRKGKPFRTVLALGLERYSLQGLNKAWGIVDENTMFTPWELDDIFYTQPCALVQRGQPLDLFSHFPMLHLS